MVWKSPKAAGPTLLGAKNVVDLGSWGNGRRNKRRRALSLTLAFQRLGSFGKSPGEPRSREQSLRPYRVAFQSRLFGNRIGPSPGSSHVPCQGPLVYCSRVSVAVAPSRPDPSPIMPHCVCNSDSGLLIKRALALVEVDAALWTVHFAAAPSALMGTRPNALTSELSSVACVSHRRLPRTRHFAGAPQQIWA